MKKLLLSIVLITGSFFTNAQTNDYSMSLDGVNDYIEFKSNSPFNTDTNSFSYQLSFMITNTADLTASIYGSLFSKGGSNLIKYNGYGVNIVRDNGKVVVNAFMGSNNIKTYIRSTTIIEDNIWYNVAMTVNRKTDEFKLYINGVVEDSTSIKTIGSLDNTWPVQFFRGYWPPTKVSAHYFDGTIDNIAFWDTVLTKKDVLQYMKCYPSGKESNLNGYWNFEKRTSN